MYLWHQTYLQLTSCYLGLRFTVRDESSPKLVDMESCPNRGGEMATALETYAVRVRRGAREGHSRRIPKQGLPVFVDTSSVAKNVPIFA